MCCCICAIAGPNVIPCDAPLPQGRRDGLVPARLDHYRSCAPRRTLERCPYGGRPNRDGTGLEWTIDRIEPAPTSVPETHSRHHWLDYGSTAGGEGHQRGLQRALGIPRASTLTKPLIRREPARAHWLAALAQRTPKWPPGMSDALAARGSREFRPIPRRIPGRCRSRRIKRSDLHRTACRPLSHRCRNRPPGAWAVCGGPIAPSTPATKDKRSRSNRVMSRDRQGGRTAISDRGRHSRPAGSSKHRTAHRRGGSTRRSPIWFSNTLKASRSTPTAIEPGSVWRRA